MVFNQSCHMLTKPPYKYHTQVRLDSYTNSYYQLTSNMAPLVGSSPYDAEENTVRSLGIPYATADEILAEDIHTLDDMSDLDDSTTNMHGLDFVPYTTPDSEDDVGLALNKAHFVVLHCGSGKAEDTATHIIQREARNRQMVGGMINTEKATRPPHFFTQLESYCMLNGSHCIIVVSEGCQQAEMWTYLYLLFLLGPVSTMLELTDGTNFEEVIGAPFPSCENDMALTRFKVYQDQLAERSSLQNIEDSTLENKDIPDGLEKDEDFITLWKEHITDRAAREGVDLDVWGDETDTPTKEEALDMLENDKLFWTKWVVSLKLKAYQHS